MQDTIQLHETLQSTLITKVYTRDDRRERHFVDKQQRAPCDPFVIPDSHHSLLLPQVSKLADTIYYVTDISLGQAALFVPAI